MTMGSEKKGKKTEGSNLFNITNHSYTYNKKYNTFWRSFALQPSPWKQVEEIVERRFKK